MTIMSTGDAFVGRYTGLRMANTSLIDAVNSLSPEEQALVLQFIDYLKRQSGRSGSPFLQAAEQFIADHPELPRRLAQ
jgi:hypothetical protein